MSSHTDFQQYGKHADAREWRSSEEPGGDHSHAAIEAFSRRATRWYLPCSSETLCDNCAHIDFDVILNLAINRKKAVEVANLGVLAQVSTSTICDLCRFFADVRFRPDGISENLLTTSDLQRTNDERKITYKLYAFSTMRYFGIDPSYQGTGPSQSLRDVSLLGVFPGHMFSQPSPKYMDGSGRQGKRSARLFYIAAEARSRFRKEDILRGSEPILGKRLYPDCIDFGRLKEWTTKCRENHEACNTLKTLNALPGLRLIDCESRNVISAADKPYEYAALSYVWGDTPHDATATDGCIEYLPATIEDAILVALKFGLNYLWVDRYCIDQNSESKHDQIRQMDRIYQEAQITIIASAGNNPLHGLPGVGSANRNSQQEVRLGLYVLCTMPTEPTTEIQDSVWNSRAWTYQEGLLSRRRLVFTESQVFYQCRLTYRMECLSIPILRPPFGNIFLRPPFPLSRSGIMGSILDLNYIISQYMKRNTSYQSDTVNAMAGILNAFQSEGTLACHLQGIPIRSCDFTSSQDCTRALCEGLCWDMYKRQDAWAKDPWYTRDIMRNRRKGFPTWSWAGWDLTGWIQRGFQFRTSNLGPQPPANLISIGLRLELPDGSIIPWKDYATQQGRAYLSTFLIVDSLSFECDLGRSINFLMNAKKCPLSDISLSESLWHAINISAKPWSRIDDYIVHLDIEDQPTSISTQWDLVVLNLLEDPSRLEILIVKRVAENHYERVGLLTIHFQDRGSRIIRELLQVKIYGLNFKRKTIRIG